jgi:prevent-host-death family protein
MKRVGVFEGKTHFSALVDEAEHGATVVITRKGKEAARLVPPASTTERRLGIDDDLGYIADDFDASLPPELLAEFYK